MRGRKWEKEIYKISNIRLSDIIIFHPSIEVDKLSVRQSYFLNNFSGKTKDKIQYLIRLNKIRAAFLNTNCAKGLESYLYEIDAAGEISIIRDSKTLNFRNLCRRLP